MKDPFSRKILEALQQDPRMTVQEISERVGLSTTPCWKRIKEMEAQGLIAGYAVRVDRKKLGLDLMVVAEVNLLEHTERIIAGFDAAVAAMPEIVRCYAATGQADYILTILAKNVDHYEQLLLSKIFRFPGVSRVRSAIVLREIKADGLVPL